MKKAVFPGSFDPFTVGHKAIVEQALSLFDSIIIAIGENNSKKSLFSAEQRVAHIQAIFANNPKITVCTYNTLTVDFCEAQQALFIIRGVRNSADFEFEKSIAHTNSELCPRVQTLFFITPPQFSHISSSIVRDLIQYKRNVASYIPCSNLLVC
ncbi:MAG: pantetheine-phosphate adenylyltransferase [Bacteroidales bacterium]|jgi:pantetheine-phosphate adenylyltransferase|nr:pantetheine-phosphate adenylyltransferase [Bacteroidales bacterium]